MRDLKNDVDKLTRYMDPLPDSFIDLQTWICRNGNFSLRVVSLKSDADSKITRRTLRHNAEESHTAQRHTVYTVQCFPPACNIDDFSALFVW